METLDVYCVQFVVQSIERVAPDLGNSIIESINLRFGEQHVYISSKPIVFELDEKSVSIKKGKICFCEKDQLGFEIIVKMRKGYASNQVSFISYEDKKDRSILQASIPLRNAFHKPLFVIHFASSRHLLKNLGRQIETESIGIQATPKSRNHRSQTDVTERLNVAVQTPKKSQRNVWTLNTTKTKEVSTQTDDSLLSNLAEDKKALLKLIMLLVCKLSTRLSGQSRVRPVEARQPRVVEVVPPEPEVDLEAARDFSNLRKRQIEQMRERLHQMAEERREILQMTAAGGSKGHHPVDPGRGIKQQPIAVFLEPNNSNEQPAALLEPTPTLIPEIATSTRLPEVNQPPETKAPSVEISTAKERVILSPRQLSSSRSPEQEPLPQTPEISEPSTDKLDIDKHVAFSRPESALSSLPSEAADELEELPSPVRSPLQSPKPTSALRRKSYTLAEASQESVKSQSNFLEPTVFVPTKNLMKQKSVEFSDVVSTHPVESERSSRSSTESETESTASSSETESSSDTSTSSSSSESSTPSSSSSASTLKRSSSSSTLGGGSVSTEESVQEEIPEELADNSSADSVKSDSSIFETTPVPGRSPELSPTSKYFSKEARRKSFDRKPYNTDSVSSYAPSD